MLRFFFSLAVNRIVTHKENSVFIWDKPMADSCGKRKVQLPCLEAGETSVCKVCYRALCRIQAEAGTLPGITLFLGSFFLYPLPVSPENISLIYNLYVSPYLRLCF